VVLRTSPEGDEHVLTLTNVTGKELQLGISLKELGVDERLWQDLIGDKHWEVVNSRLQVVLRPYDVTWLKPIQEIEGKGRI
jgi:sucrose phosphorylase